MTPNQYQTEAMSMMADQEKIRQRIYDLGPSATMLENGVRGLQDDAGELSSAVKKHFEYGQPLDVPNILEECGDCFWRLNQILTAVGLTFEQCLEANIAKLKVRYKTGKCNDQEASNRDLDAERRVLESRVLDRDREMLMVRDGTISERRMRTECRGKTSQSAGDDLFPKESVTRVPPQIEDGYFKTAQGLEQTGQGFSERKEQDDTDVRASVGSTLCVDCGQPFSEEHPGIHSPKNHQSDTMKMYHQHGCPGEKK